MSKLRYRREFETFNDMWAAMVADVRQHGMDLPSRNGPCREVLGWSGTLLDLDAAVLVSRLRKFDPAFAAAELLWYMTGGSTAEMLAPYAPQYVKFANPQVPGGFVCGAYGRRMLANPGYAEGRASLEVAKDGLPHLSQLDAIVRLLTDQPDTRQAVLALWDSGDIARAAIGGWNDLPCTLVIQFISRKRESGYPGRYLHAAVTMRSNDLWLGTPYDVHAFAAITQLLCSRLEDTAPGTLTWSVGSLHVYERDAKKLLGAEEPDLGLEYPMGYYVGRWMSPPANSNGHEDRLNQAWSIQPHAEREKIARAKFPIPATDWYKTLPSTPLSDAGEVCVAKWDGRAKQGLPLPENVHAATRRAWEIKYGKKEVGKDAAS